MLRECRKAVFPDILDAAEALGVAERTLRGYEAQDYAPADVIERMAELYNAPELRFWYLSKHPVGQKIMPQVQAKSITAAALGINNSALNLSKDFLELAVIADDDKISEDEVQPTLQIRERLHQAWQRIAEAILSIDKQITEKQTSLRRASV